MNNNQDALLKVKDLSVCVEDTQILSNLNLTIHPGETHVLMGPNGAGKSTLGYALMGNPNYKVTSGSILFDGEEITYESADVRARKGLFLSFQSPVEIPGITVEKFIRSAMLTCPEKKLSYMAFKKRLKEMMEVLSMDESYATRDLNVGFSGGERKKTEILQLLMLNPRLAILDETDSGLDVDAVRTVSQGVLAYQKRNDGALLIITHNTKILESLSIDRVHVLVKGKLKASGDASLIKAINDHGFEQYLKSVEMESQR